MKNLSNINQELNDEINVKFREKGNTLPKPRPQPQHILGSEKLPGSNLRPLSCLYNSPIIEDIDPILESNSEPISQSVISNNSPARTPEISRTPYNGNSSETINFRILSHLIKIEEQNNIILCILRKRHLDIFSLDTPEWTSEFPLKTLEDLKIFDDKLSSEETFQSVVKHTQTHTHTVPINV